MDLRQISRSYVLLKQSLGHHTSKTEVARETGIPTSKTGMERKIGKIGINALFGKKNEKE